jgi:SAM-dependent methyltransferase
MAAYLTYNHQSEEMAQRYEDLSFEQVHRDILSELPPKGAMVLDVGAGSGRDAAWFATQEYQVVAVEPSIGMRTQAQKYHAESAIHWLDDALPSLSKTHQLGLNYDFILLSAVWMHVLPQQRERAFRKLVTLLRPSGRIAISLRLGEPDLSREMHSVSLQEVYNLAHAFGLHVIKTVERTDLQGRNNVQWTTVVLGLPDDGLGSLPLIRHIILKDDKSSTYKIALLRVIARIADSASGLVRFEDEHVALPLGLVSLFWVRMFKPFIEKDWPQSPTHNDGKGLGFIGAEFHHLRSVSHLDLRVGMSFSGQIAQSLHTTIHKASDTIKNMPVRFMTWPNEDRAVFSVVKSKKISAQPTLILDAAYLWSIGTFYVPLAIWKAFTHYTVWIEPVLVAEWARLVANYAQKQGKSVSVYAAMEALTWTEPERDTSVVRDITKKMLNNGQSVQCVWTGKLLQNQFDIDHCFPFSAWPCNDFWNLMPTHPSVNLQKSAKLITVQTLRTAQDRIIDWWQSAYLSDGMPVGKVRFYNEAQSALPLLDQLTQPEDVIDAMQLHRERLKQDQQLSDWVR